MHTPPPHPMDEEERLAALKRYRILDTGPEQQFERVVSIAKRQFDVPVALVAFMDSDRNFLKGRGELPFSESPRDISFCGHTILDDAVMVVPDATKDARFRESPLVTEGHCVRFYAGAPLVTPSGHRIGTVCLFDFKPRDVLQETEREKLQDLASIVVDHLEMRLIVGNVHDEIETRRAAEAKATRLALYDTLTGLPNRAHLNKIFAEGLPSPRKAKMSALYADLDAFKSTNDALGHHAGDQLLRNTAETICAAAGEHAFVARVSGDEFVVLLDGKTETAERIARELVGKTRQPLTLNGHTISVGLSVGVAHCEDGETGLEALVRRADLALYEAKRSGRAKAVIFNLEMAALADRRHKLEKDLAAAIRSGEIKAYFQPIHRTSDRTMTGVEALARWTHPELGAVSPLEFVRLAEDTGLIIELGNAILRDALRAAQLWDGLFISVNLSPVQFRLPDLAHQIQSLLAERRFPAQRLELEVTESVLLHDVDAARAQIKALQALGVKVSLDDFGTGYSSLSYLRSLPFNKVKIDRSFVTDVHKDQTKQAIVQCIVELARQMEMRITAEGVETEEEAIVLQAAGCGTLQGYYFGKPMPAVSIQKLISERKQALLTA